MLKKFLAILATLALGAGLAVTTASVANAADAEPYVLALWERPSVTPKFPQTLVAYQATDSTDVHALDNLAVKCGTTYQSDLYANDAATATLLGKPALDGSGESWPGGSYQSAFSNSFTTAACPPPTAKADYGITPATCKVGEILVEGETKNATWDDSAAAAWGTVGPADYTITATATGGAVGDQFPGGVATFSGHLNGPNAALCGYVTAAWLVPGGPSSIWNPDQTLITSVTTPTPSLNALDTYAFPECSYIQIDVYHDDAVTDTLLSGGVLYDPPNPTEHLIDGGEGTAWKYIITDCPPPPVIEDCDVITTVNVNQYNYTTVFPYREVGPGADKWGTPNNGNGSATFVAGGLHVVTTDAISRVRWLSPITLNPTDKWNSEIVAAGAGPSVQLDVDIDGDTVPDGGIYRDASYNWTANPPLTAWINAHGAIGPHVGVPTSVYYGSQSDWLDLYPLMKPVEGGFGVGRGGIYDTTIQSITAGCTKFVFGLLGQPAPEKRQVTVSDVPDCELNIVTATTTYYETPYVYDPVTNKFVLGDEEVVDVEKSVTEATEEECPQQETLGPIVPNAFADQEECAVEGTYTLVTPAAEPGLPDPSVLWFVNGSLIPTPAGTYVVSVPNSITVVAKAQLGYTFETLDGFTLEQTFGPFTFEEPDCDPQLTTLAVTGQENPSGALALAGLLGLLGLALVRGARQRLPAAE